MDDREMQRKAREHQGEGAKDELKGKVRGDLGDLTDSREQHAKGRAQEAKGKAQRKAGEALEELSTDEEETGRSSR